MSDNAVLVYNPDITGLTRSVSSMREEDLVASAMCFLFPMFLFGIPALVNWGEQSYIWAVILTILTLAVIGSYAWVCVTWGKHHRNTRITTENSCVIEACQAWIRFQRLASSSNEFAAEYKIGLPALHRAVWAMAVLAEPETLDKHQAAMLQSRLDEINNFVATMEELTFTATGLNVDGSNVQHLKLQMQSLVEMMEGER